MSTPRPAAGTPEAAGPAPAADGLEGLLGPGPVDWARVVTSLYQPVVELDSLAVLGYEAVVRGPQGTELEGPAALFAAARDRGQVVELDWACRQAACRGALGAALPRELALFLNVEPLALGRPEPEALTDLVRAVDRELTVVMEITERALTRDPAGLLRAAARARAHGWRIALDDVGADRTSLALLPFLRPEVIKLDLRLVQARTTVDVAEIVGAVNAEAERTGAVVLAEGIETEEQAALALMMGARLGQGWLFGRPAELPAHLPVPRAERADDRDGATRPVRLPKPARAHRAGSDSSDSSGPDLPFDLADPQAVRRATKPLLVAVSRQLERQALTLGDAAVVLATFQTARHFTPTTGLRYAALAASCAFAGAFAAGLDAEPARGVRGTGLRPDEPLSAEWDVVVVGPHFAGALLARDLGDGGPDEQRRFDYQVTYDRETVLAAAVRLMQVVTPVADDPGARSRLPTPVEVVRDGSGTAGPLPGAADGGLLQHPGVALQRAPRVRSAEQALALPGELDRVLTAAVVNAPYGVTVSDARHPERPLVWMNRAFSQLSGYAPEQVLGRSCRFLQGPGTDPEVVHGLRRQLQAGRSARVTFVNHRRDGTPFWNDLQLTPVHDRDGTLTHWVGQQHDVTERVHAQQQADYLAGHDPLTGLANRTQLQARLAVEAARADRAGTAMALLYLDVDDFKTVNDTYGHAAGDHLLTVVADRLQSASRTDDLLARLGGDEFLLLVTGLRADPHAVASQRAEAILAALSAPLLLPTSPPLPVVVQASIGISVYPYDARSADLLLQHADSAMYDAKSGGRHRARLWQPTGSSQAG